MAYYCLRLRMNITTPLTAIKPKNPPPTKMPFFAMKVCSSTFIIIWLLSQAKRVLLPLNMAFATQIPVLFGWKVAVKLPFDMVRHSIWVVSNDPIS